MSDQTRRSYNVRAYVGPELYERILRDAAVQRCSVSDCVRDMLEELYAIRDELSRPLETGAADGTQRGPLAHRLLGQMEERMTGGLSRQLAEIHLLGDLLRRLEAMADRQYVSLMLYLPDLSDVELEERSASVNRRYEAWRRAVDRLLDPSKRRPQ
jgi:hypothetical protein